MVLRAISSSLKSAIKWISEEKKTGSTKADHLLIEEASINFDLDPQETEYLLRNISQTIT